jgi:hypothetical protein
MEGVLEVQGVRLGLAATEEALTQQLPPLGLMFMAAAAVAVAAEVAAEVAAAVAPAGISM